MNSFDLYTSCIVIRIVLQRFGNDSTNLDFAKDDQTKDLGGGGKILISSFKSVLHDQE